MEFEHHAQLCSYYSGANYGGPARPAVIAASVVLPEADFFQGWYGGVNLLNDVRHHSEGCTKVGMRTKCTYQSPVERRRRCVENSLGLRLANSTVCFSHFPVRGMVELNMTNVD